MKAETWIFVITTIFFALVAPAYWFIAGDWTGTTALVMSALLVAMVSLYLGFHASRMEPRPEDRKDAEIADGAGELGFFPPYSWWPLWCSLTMALCTFAIALAAWWLLIIGGVFGTLALCGWIFEYYRGEHAH
ncbi:MULTISPECIES: cytochrome c oxidase subunit 4 [unclassified Nocardioides]|uniref:cytochrome c oxidase subunit 4 n=1 Tax=unclassified Nocardioides TaxID=2615069 RepID=UPI0006F6A62A|nr:MULTISPECIES: cytochrome c oxidase subunit 4 [unclassified Nocardioides]KQY63905.1 cytochrome C oxidase subunit IV [Nocardioides sp. Root140]KQZ69823.1 cytochrome C oxidase subunit IV [Nocardioides sp. Root151]KRF15919.1 cytochrome C oxidase subunit IV [Nocardioides sp. Soil796]